MAVKKKTISKTHRLRAKRLVSRSADKRYSARAIAQSRNKADSDESKTFSKSANAHLLRAWKTIHDGQAKGE